MWFFSRTAGLSVKLVQKSGDIYDLYINGEYAGPNFLATWRAIGRYDGEPHEIVANEHLYIYREGYSLDDRWFAFQPGQRDQLMRELRG